MRSGNKKLGQRGRRESLLELGTRRSQNRLLPRRERRERKRQISKAALYELEEPGAWTVRMHLVAQICGIAVLLPLAFITTETFLTCLSHAIDTSAWRTAPFWFFSLGLILWLGVFFFIWRPIFLYVLGHEITHALCTWLCFGRVYHFNVTSEGGFVETSKSNLLISLSPYFIPLYSVVAALVFWLVGSYIDLTAWHATDFPWLPGYRWEWAGFWVLGFTWGFHLTFTVWMIAKDQPDLRGNGTVFSINLIYLVNILLLCALIVLAAPGLTWRNFCDEWVLAAGDLRQAVNDFGHWMHRLVEPL